MKVQMTFSNEGLTLTLTGNELSLYKLAKTIDECAINQRETITKDHRYIESEITGQSLFRLVN